MWSGQRIVPNAGIDANPLNGINKSIIQQNRPGIRDWRCAMMRHTHITAIRHHRLILFLGT
jgi:hypothetical protein